MLERLPGGNAAFLMVTSGCPRPKLPRSANYVLDTYKLPVAYGVIYET